MGFAVDGQRSQKANKRKHKSKLKRYENKTGAHYTSSKSKYKTIDKEKLAKFSEGFQLKQKAIRKKQLTAFGIIFGVLLCALIYFLFFHEMNYHSLLG
ncbi:hypothetical protein [Neptunitalea lumnitzerae]|uniref:Triple QxxK/R motif-containing protein n=1 Tax=Neptunitalea lumnitzerae TaxID=2965509 RepID=A0ABQ5MMR4_9FLAO|nr:hypothetical protein [Neptunitalea sp. Y10]GLB50390.1 hypothetical protein Y10_27580 [Neptunitalea sp. Y10]